MNTVKEKKGFTLAELLIVVAIIGILVAVSIPVFSGQRHKAVVATNQANIRAAKAAAYADYLSVGNTQLNSFYDYNCQKGDLETNWYSAAQGKTVSIGDGNLDNWKSNMVYYQQTKHGNDELYSDIVVLVSSKGILTCPYYNETTKTILGDTFK